MELLTSNQKITQKLQRAQSEANSLKVKRELETGAYTARWVHALSPSPPHMPMAPLVLGNC